MYEEQTQRAKLSSYSTALNKMGVTHKLVEFSGTPALVVPVNGPENENAQFTIISTPVAIEGITNLQGVYFSAMLPEGNFASWNVKNNDAPEEICRVLIRDFVDECFYQEHDNFLTVEMINDDNRPAFISIIRDEDLMTPNQYVIGVRIKSPEKEETAGVLSFHFTEVGLDVDYIFVCPQFRHKGIATFLLEYIRQLIVRGNQPA